MRLCPREILFTHHFNAHVPTPLLAVNANKWQRECITLYICHRIKDRANSFYIGVVLDKRNGRPNRFQLHCLPACLLFLQCVMQFTIFHCKRNTCEHVSFVCGELNTVLDLYTNYT